jgi:single-stranded-DNA-specific exonuclease
VRQLLFDRELTTQQAIDEFFNPDYADDLHDPYLMLGMQKAVKAIKKAIDNKKKILVFGDYDADGICSTVIIKETLEKIGAKKVETYIPDRSKEGYGLNEQAVADFAKRNIELMITVDCGITEVDNIAYAKALGIDTIIADHHQCPPILPQALAIINPHQKKDKYPFKDLAAVGVAFKLAQALVKEFKVSDDYLKWFLDLVSLATVADMVPLLGENRTLVKYGLVVLTQTKRIGLKKLMEAARVTDFSLEVKVNSNGQKEHKVNGLDSMTYAFVLAPRINVAARLENVDSAYRLLTTLDEQEAQEIAQRLETLNRQRQQMVKQIVDEIIKRLPSDKMPKIICEGGDNWSTGVVGLIAGKIKDRYNRPTIICNTGEDEVRCSARSIDKLNLVDALRKCEKLLVAYGGHPRAAGLSVKKKNFESLKKQLAKIAETQLSEDDLEARLTIDAELDAQDINWENYDQIQLFEPFGQSNPSPTFVIRDLEVVDIKMVGNNASHLRLELLGSLQKDDSEMLKIKAIGFGLGERGYSLKIGDRIDLVFELIADQWNGTRNLQLKILDYKKHV